MTNCPHCHAPIESAPHLAGQLVECPHCRGQFTMPHAGVVVAPVHAVATHQPQVAPVFISTAPRTKRLRSSGWFSRAFSGTAGVAIAIMLVFVGVPLLAFVLMCGGCSAMFSTAARVVEEERVKDNAELRKHAMPVLASHGITQLSDDCRFITIGSVWSIEGKALDRAGDTREVLIEIERTPFADHVRWEVQRVVVDGVER